MSENASIVISLFLKVSLPQLVNNEAVKVSSPISEQKPF